MLSELTVRQVQVLTAAGTGRFIFVQKMLATKWSRWMNGVSINLHRPAVKLDPLIRSCRNECKLILGACNSTCRLVLPWSSAESQNKPPPKRMAFQPGFVEAIEMNQIERIETDSDGNEETIKPKIGKDVIIGGQEPWKLCEMSRKSDIGWEAAMVTPDCPGRFLPASRLIHSVCRGAFI
jgi:hypothetical protein